MLLEILTPDKKIFEGQVDTATFPGSKGSFQVLNNHAPPDFDTGQRESDI